jgi:hypothetical protein
LDFKKIPEFDYNLSLEIVPSLDYETIHKLCNAIAYTSRIKSLRLPTKSPLGQPHYIRPQAHACICGGIGQGKSSILRSLSMNMDLPLSGSFTKAGLLGSISKDGENISPLIWDGRKNPIFVDEFYMSGRTESADFNNCLLSVMEEQGYSRKLGYHVKDIEHFDDKDKSLFYSVKSSNIRLKTRVSFIFSSMQNFFRANLPMQKKAFNTRVILLPCYQLKADIKKMARGEVQFRFKKFNPDEEIRISPAAYKKIYNLVDENQTRKDSILRTIGDLCRLYAIVGWKMDYFAPILLQRKYFNKEEAERDT